MPHPTLVKVSAAVQQKRLSSLQPSPQVAPSPQSARRNGFGATPSGFRLGGGVKEMHGHPIYCVAWSSDAHQVEPSAVPSVEAKQTARNSLSHRVTPSDVESTETESSSAANETREKAQRGGKSDENCKESSSSESVRYRQCFATCGGNHVTIYETVLSDATTKPGSSTASATATSSGGLELRQTYVDPDENEVYFTCAFGGRSLGSHVNFGPVGKIEQTPKGPIIVLTTKDDNNRSERESGSSSQKKRRKKRDKVGHGGREQPNDPQNGIDSSELYTNVIDVANYDGPQLLCVAGSSGIIKVIDTVRRMLFLTLSGHGDEINDIKFSPTNDWLLLSASKDESLRLWNVQTATCVAIFGGHEGHRDSILSLGWHPHGDKFISAGMDTSIKLWSMEEGTEVHRAIIKSNTAEPKMRWGLPQKRQTPNDTSFQTIYEQMPYFSTNEIHTDYVDCVQFVGDLVLSKSISDTIVLWQPILKERGRSNKSGGGHRLPHKVVALREFTLNKCDVWFIRFRTDAQCRMLAIGNNVGDIKVWEIGGSSFNPQKKSFANLSNQLCSSTVRMVAFSPDGNSIISCCDDSTVWKWDAV
eukprot:CAMPEP_0198297212 /NCGR_PEP_ID=MMETSP1449-20131203/36033_1 /TAXON_ID=420275 /ORGANISM="Attheya septentrionalis, Strain CCMP2084" /LENGTH=586 /DNA_ID=CAMNT_0043998085 /DNA_START=156 /DNA_END=1916 /DNA_ORIENTATION=-